MSSPARRLQTRSYGWWQPARFLRPAGPPSPLSQASGSGAEAGAILSPPAPALRNDLPGSVPRNGGPGESRHGGPGGWPPVQLRRPPAILSCLSDRSERHTPGWKISLQSKQTRSAILGWHSWFWNRFHNGQRKCGKFSHSRLVLFPIPGKTGHFLLPPRP